VPSATRHFWLSHHLQGEFHRCYRFGAVLVCARCLGTYPVLATVLAAQFIWKWPLDSQWDLPAGVALAVPAILDWAWGRFRPHAFGNSWRTITGLLLGLGLGRTLYVHVHEPFPPALVAQLALAGTVLVLVLIASFLRRSASDSMGEGEDGAQLDARSPGSRGDGEKQGRPSQGMQR
jgi:uncharacterized membrane protein